MEEYLYGGARNIKNLFQSKLSNNFKNKKRDYYLKY